jgi:tetratricopeptide (TPR) repeat protein
MSTDFNEKLRDLCAKGGALFADIEDVLSKASSDSIVGREILLEHLHPTSRGYFLIAKEYARIMKEHELAASATEWSVGDTLSDEAHWNNRVLTTLDDRAAQRRTELLVSSWPFVSMDRPLQPVPNSDRIGLLVDRLLGGTLSWEAAHVAAAEYYEGSGEFALAEREYQLLVDMIPINASPYLRLGRLYLKQLKYEEGYAVLKQSLTIEPTVYASRALGAIAVDTGNPAEAIPFLETAVRLGGTRAEEAQSLYLLALACGRAGLTERARNEVVKAVAADPSHKEARDLMTRLNNLP